MHFLKIKCIQLPVLVHCGKVLRKKHAEVKHSVRFERVSVQKKCTTVFFGKLLSYMLSSLIKGNNVAVHIEFFGRSTTPS